MRRQIVQLEDALALQRTHAEQPLGRILVENGVLREDVVARAVAQQLGLPFVDLRTARIDEGAAKLVSSAFASRHMCVPTALSAADVTVAMVNPLDAKAIHELEVSTERRVHPVIATSADISSAIQQLYGSDAELGENEDPSRS